jgi:predicted DNA-binding WGR domain protein
LDVRRRGWKNRAMTGSFPTPLRLRRIDAARNMARFYLLSLQPTLFGEISLIRQWGRIGGEGQKKIETFATQDDAVRAWARLERIKRRRGYG